MGEISSELDYDGSEKYGSDDDLGGGIGWWKDGSMDSSDDTEELSKFITYIFLSLSLMIFSFIFLFQIIIIS